MTMNLGDNPRLHRPVLNQLGLHLLGALPPGDLPAVQVHLAACDSCAAECRDLRAVADLLDLLDDDAIEALAVVDPPPLRLDLTVTAVGPDRRALPGPAR